MQNINTLYAQVSRWAFPVLVVLLILSLITCNKQKESVNDLAARLDIQEKKTVQIENENGLLVAQNEELKTQSAKALKELTEGIFNLKRAEEKLIKEVSNYTKIIQEAKFKDKTAGYIDQPVRDPNDSTKIVYVPQPADTNLIRVPRSFSYSDSTLSFAGEVQRKGVKIDSISVPNTLHLRTVELKTGFLKLGRKTVIQAVNTNPAIVNTGISSITVDQRPNWWNRWGKPLLFGAAGVFIGREIAR